MTVSRPPIVVKLINMYFLCKDMGTLPHPGALLDQDPDIMWAFREIRAALAEKL